MRPKVMVHAGWGWPSKSFPKDWWDAVLKELIAGGITPVLMGADICLAHNNDTLKSTVNVDSTGCIDLRNKVALMDTIWMLQHTRVVLTNDSSPLHAAASGDAWIGFVSTAKLPDLITHWRHGEFGWRMKSFAKGGLWSTRESGPHNIEGFPIAYVKDEEELRSWLPDPKDYAGWAIERATE